MKIGLESVRNIIIYIADGHGKTRNITYLRRLCIETWQRARLWWSYPHWWSPWWSTPMRYCWSRSKSSASRRRPSKNRCPARPKIFKMSIFSQRWFSITSNATNFLFLLISRYIKHGIPERNKLIHSFIHLFLYSLIYSFIIRSFID